MDFGASSTDILNCDISSSSQASQIAHCLENLESSAANVSGGTSATCSQNGTLHISSIPTWLSNGMLGPSTSDTQSTGALPPVSELRPGLRAGGGLQLWALLAQMTNNQTGPEASRAATSSEKHIDDMQVCTSQNVATYHVDSTKMQDINEQSQHHGYQTEATYSYCDIQRSNLSPAESLPSLGIDVQHMAPTEAVLDVDNITSAYQQYSCIPLLNIPNNSVSSEQPSSLNGLLDDALYCTAKSNCSIPCPQQVHTVQEERQSNSPLKAASLTNSSDMISMQHIILNKPSVSDTQRLLTAEGASSLLCDSLNKSGKLVTPSASTSSKLPQPVASQDPDNSRSKDLIQTSIPKSMQNEQIARKAAKKNFSAANLVEQVVCYRCKVCLFLHESKTEAIKHAESHRQGSKQCAPAMQKKSAQQGSQEPINRAEKRFLCGKCRRGFFTLDDCCRHLSQAHKAKSKKIRLEWIYTNQPDQMRASTPAEEVALLEPTPSQDTAPKQPAPALPEFRAVPPCQVAVGSLKQAVKPVCTAPKKKEECLKALPSETSDSAVSSSQMAWRQKINREQGSFICERKGCNVRFRELENLEYHIKCHQADTPDFACPECSVVCLRWRTMTGHLWRHHLCDMELHQCDQCDFRTYSLSKLENLHKRTHGEERPFLCDVCGKGFKTGKQLRNHKAIHRQSSGQWSAVATAQGNGSTSAMPAEACSECGRCFRVRRLLQLHRDSVHRKLRPFLCSYCGHRASSQSSLKMHLRQHTGEKPFACNLCEYRTGDHNSLRRHKMRHSGTKPYKCPHCPYACIQSSTFKSHLHRKHPGQSDSLLFACPLCSFRTVREDNYKAHLSDHSSSEAQSLNGASAPASAEQTPNASSALTLGDIVGFAQSAS